MKSKTKSNAADAKQVAGRKATAVGAQVNPIVVAFAHRFKQWRRDQKKTVRQVACDLGMSGSIICEWENCQRYPAIRILAAGAD